MQGAAGGKGSHRFLVQHPGQKLRKSLTLYAPVGANSTPQIDLVLIVSSSSVQRLSPYPCRRESARGQLRPRGIGLEGNNVRIQIFI